MSIDLASGRHGGLALRHRVIVAAGGAGYGGELPGAVGELLPGAIVTRGLTRAARHSHASSHMVQLPDALLHSVARPNHGLEAVVRRQAPRWATGGVPVIVNIGADDAEDIAWMARTLDMQPDVAGIELDLSLPDRGRGGQPIGTDVEASEIATVAARAATDLPLIVKLTAAAPDLRAIARAVAAAGADAVSAIASMPAAAVARDHANEAEVVNGGLSGPALKPLGLRAVSEIAQAVRIPIIGIGGVSSLDDVLDYLAVGATAVGVATAALADPTLPGRLGQELEALCTERDVSVHDLVGAALPKRLPRRRRTGRR